MEAKTMTLKERLRTYVKAATIAGDNSRLKRDIDEAANAIEEAERALKPFADAVIGEFINDDDITADDFRRARSVRDKLKG